MSYVHTVIFTPPERADQAWNRARIEGTATIGGTPAAIETLNLQTGPGVSPIGLDTDPLNPQTRTLTTALAAFATGYLRVVFLDSDNDESAPSDLVASPGDAVTFADPRDLTDVAAVKRLLQTPVGNTVTDDLLQDMITEASVMLARELGRQFIDEPNVTKTFTYDGNGFVDLAPYDLRSVTAITWDANGITPVALDDTTGWRLDITGSVDGLFRSVALPDYARTLPVGQAVSITGDWGFEEIPPDVARGVKITVKTWLREGATFNPDGNVLAFERVGRIPRDVLDGLSHYRLPMV